MSAAEILKMIETIDPADTAKLDEIDARVWCWLNGMKFYGWAYEGIPSIAADSSNPIVYSKLEYTRSRDALKSIRPEGWHININRILDDNNFWGGWSSTSDKSTKTEDLYFHSPELPTEELSELHAIIQAIEYDRGRHGD